MRILKYLLLSLFLLTENCMISTTSDADCNRLKRERQLCLGLSIIGHSDKTEGFLKGYFLCDQNRSEFCD